MIMVPAVATHALPAVTTVTPAAPVAPDRTPWTAAVYFETDATAFSQMTLVRLERNAGILLRRPKIRVAISGAADPRGDAVYNRELGLRRAAAVRDFFVSKGVDPARLHVMSSELVLSPEENATADQLAADRRVDLRALYFDGRPMNHFLDD
jgi:outer membrane protein OmpA-like peptidoglycan-associated protein